MVVTGPKSQAYAAIFAHIVQAPTSTGEMVARNNARDSRAMASITLGMRFDKLVLLRCLYSLGGVRSMDSPGCLTPG